MQHVQKGQKKSHIHWSFCVSSTKQAIQKKYFLIGNMQNKTFSKNVYSLKKKTYVVIISGNLSTSDRDQFSKVRVL